MTPWYRATSSFRLMDYRWQNGLDSIHSDFPLALDDSNENLVITAHERARRTDVPKRIHVKWYRFIRVNFKVSRSVSFGQAFFGNSNPFFLPENKDNQVFFFRLSVDRFRSAWRLFRVYVKRLFVFQDFDVIVLAGSSVMYYLRNFMRRASEFNRTLLVSLVRPRLANSIQLSAITVSWKRFRCYLVAILLRQSLGVATLHGHETMSRDNPNTYHHLAINFFTLRKFRWFNERYLFSTNAKLFWYEIKTHLVLGNWTVCYF